jgi:DNA helicase II / ATP-dependent DNA helicase PcrA
MWGPPGTGKTTRLARSTAATVRERGADSIRIASFSVTAAKEIASRQEVRSVLPGGAVGTLHSHALRALVEDLGDRPSVAHDDDVLGDWNAQVGPTWRITGDSRGRGLEHRDRAGAGGAESGDALLEQVDLLRASGVKPGKWPAHVQAFYARWAEWKRTRGAVDYTDMIVQAYHLARRGQQMPGAPSVFVVDEAQDMTGIEAALAFAWGANLGPDGRLVFALDDDQAIMEWRGGDPGVILAAEVDDDEVLSKSYRVPPAVHAAAEAWIRRCTSRYPKLYAARDPDDERDPSPEHSIGWAQRVTETIGDPRLVDRIEADLSDPDEPDTTVMVLASCSYMLGPLIKSLRQRGIPYHNPYRPGEGAWNPIRKPDKGISTAERIFRYLVLDKRTLGERARPWTGEDIAAWTHLVAVKAAGMRHGATNHIRALPNGTVDWDTLSALWADSEAGDLALARATCAGGDPADHLEWLAEAITPSRAAATAYPLQVARSQGPAALIDTPRVVVGTIHSVKGATADRVYVSPDLSGAGMRQWREGMAGRDQITRLMYVAMTRAYHQLNILAPTSAIAVPPSELLPPSLERRR